MDSAEIDTTTRYVGTIKVFFRDKKYGFIDCPETHEIYNTDVFLSQMNLGSFWKGSRVSFTVKLGKAGKPQAHDLEDADEGADAPAADSADSLRQGSDAADDSANHQKQQVQQMPLVEVQLGAPLQPIKAPEVDIIRIPPDLPGYELWVANCEKFPYSSTLRGQMFEHEMQWFQQLGKAKELCKEIRLLCEGIAGGSGGDVFLDAESLPNRQIQGFQDPRLNTVYRPNIQEKVNGWETYWAWDGAFFMYWSKGGWTINYRWDDHTVQNMRFDNLVAARNGKWEGIAFFSGTEGKELFNGEWSDVRLAFREVLEGQENEPWEPEPLDQQMPDEDEPMPDKEEKAKDADPDDLWKDFDDAWVNPSWKKKQWSSNSGSQAAKSSPSRSLKRPAPAWEEEDDDWGDAPETSALGTSEQAGEDAWKAAEAAMKQRKKQRSGENADSSQVKAKSEPKAKAEAKAKPEAKAKGATQKSLAKLKDSLKGAVKPNPKPATADAAEDWDALIEQSMEAANNGVDKKLPGDSPNKKTPQKQENTSKAAAGLAQKMAADMAKDHEEVVGDDDELQEMLRNMEKKPDEDEEVQEMLRNMEKKPDEDEEVQEMLRNMEKKPAKDGEGIQKADSADKLDVAPYSTDGIEARLPPKGEVPPFADPISTKPVSSQSPSPAGAEEQVHQKEGSEAATTAEAASTAEAATTAEASGIDDFDALCAEVQGKSEEAVDDEFEKLLAESEQARA